MDKEIAETLAPVKDKPFIVFHDAYQYFEHHYGVTASGSEPCADCSAGVSRGLGIWRPIGSRPGRPPGVGSASVEAGMVRACSGSRGDFFAAVSVVIAARIF